MYRVDSDGATNALPVCEAADPTGKGYFQKGNPGAGIRATVLDADWCNTVQEEIAKVIETGGGLALDKATAQPPSQLYNSIITMIAAGPGPVALGKSRNLGLANATTTDANDSIKIQGAAAALSATNKLWVGINHQTSPGRSVALSAQADVTIKISGAIWDLDTLGDFTGEIRVYAINDAGTLKFGLAMQGRLNKILDTNTSATPSSVNSKTKMLVNTTLTSGTWPCVEVGWFNASFTDSTNKWVVATAIGDINVGIPAPTHTDGVAFTMTPTGTVSDPVKGTGGQDIAVWSRVGDKMKMRWDFSQTVAGSIGSGVYLFPIPASARIDANKQYAATAGGRGILGYGQVTAAAATFFAQVKSYSATHLSIVFIDTSNASGGMNDMNSTTAPFNNSISIISIECEFFVKGWSV